MPSRATRPLRRKAPAVLPSNVLIVRKERSGLRRDAVARAWAETVGLETLFDACALNDGEREVVFQAMLGKSNGRIARDCSLAPVTVKSRLHCAYAKLPVSCKRELRTLFYGAGRLAAAE